MLSSCWAPCFMLDSGYLNLEKASKIIAIYTGVVHFVFFFYGISLLFGGQSEVFFSPFFEFNRKDIFDALIIFVVYCILYIIICSWGLIHGIRTVSILFTLLDHSKQINIFSTGNSIFLFTMAVYVLVGNILYRSIWKLHTLPLLL